MSVPECLFLFQDLEGLTEVLASLSAGMSGRKLPLWADLSFLTEASFSFLSPSAVAIRLQECPGARAGKCPKEGFWRAFGHLARSVPNRRAIRVNRFARIDSQKKPYFHNVRAIRANRLKPAIRNFLPPEARFAKKFKGFSSGTLKR